MKMKYKYLSRKLIFGIVLLTIATVFVMLDKCTSSEWIEYTKWIFGIYVTGNGAEWIIKKNVLRKKNKR